MEATGNMQKPREDLGDQALSLQSIEFPDLNKVLDQLVQRANGPKANRWERWSLIFGLAGASIGLLLGTTLPGKFGLVALYGGLLIEMSGFALHIALVVKRDWRQFRHARVYHAEDLETGYQQHQEIVELLRQFSFEQRQRRLRYVQQKRATMHERLGLFVGGMERLGVVPLLLAFYLQFKDWQWGDLKALGSITFTQALLAFALMLAYAMFWHLIFLRVRVQAYESLLAEANRQDEESKNPEKAA